MSGVADWPAAAGGDCVEPAAIVCVHTDADMPINSAARENRHGRRGMASILAQPANGWLAAWPDPHGLRTAFAFDEHFTQFGFQLV
jgi:hypothetical protein